MASLSNTELMNLLRQIVKPTPFGGMFEQAQPVIDPMADAFTLLRKMKDAGIPIPGEEKPPSPATIDRLQGIKEMTIAEQRAALSKELKTARQESPSGVAIIGGLAFSPYQAAITTGGVIGHQLAEPEPVKVYLRKLGIGIASAPLGGVPFTEVVPEARINVRDDASKAAQIAGDVWNAGGPELVISILAGMLVRPKLSHADEFSKRFSEVEAGNRAGLAKEAPLPEKMRVSLAAAKQVGAEFAQKYPGENFDRLVGAMQRSARATMKATFKAAPERMGNLRWAERGALDLTRGPLSPEQAAAQAGKAVSQEAQIAAGAKALGSIPAPPAPVAMPELVYHGSPEGDIQSFFTRPEATGKNTRAATASLGAFFTESADIATHAAFGFSSLPTRAFSGKPLTVYTVKLGLRNPLNLDAATPDEVTNLESMFPGFRDAYEKAGEDKMPVLRFLARARQRTVIQENFDTWGRREGLTSEEIEAQFKARAGKEYVAWKANQDLALKEIGASVGQQRLKELGYDGIVLRTQADSGDVLGPQRQYVVFDPENITIVGRSPVGEAPTPSAPDLLPGETKRKVLKALGSIPARPAPQEGFDAPLPDWAKEARDQIKAVIQRNPDLAESALRSAKVGTTAKAWATSLSPEQRGLIERQGADPLSFYRVARADAGMEAGIPAPLAPVAKEPWEMTREEYVGTRKPERPDFSAGILNAVGTGAPGLSSVSKKYGIGKIPVQGHEVAYRDPNGAPIAAARLVPQGNGFAVKDFAADKSRGLLSGRAVVAVAKELDRLGAMQTGGTMSPDAAKFIHHWKVKQALSAGKPVPPAVLADYPDLAKPTASAAEKTARVPDLEPGQTKRKVLHLVAKDARRMADEASGQLTLEQMAEQGRKPKDVITEFFAETYDTLEPHVRERVDRYVRSLGPDLSADLTGKDIKAIGASNAPDFGSDPLALEGASRGFVVMADVLNKMRGVAVSKIEASAAIPPPAEPTATERQLQEIAETKSPAVLKRYAQAENVQPAVTSAAVKKLRETQALHFDVSEERKAELQARWAAGDAAKERIETLKAMVGLDSEKPAKPPKPPKEPPGSTLLGPEDEITPLVQNEPYLKMAAERIGVPAEEAVRRFGPEGVEIGVKLTRAEVTERQFAGELLDPIMKAMRPYLRFGLFTPGNMADVTKLLDPEKFGVLANPTKGQLAVAEAFRASSKKIADRASAAGVEIALEDGTKEPFSEHIVENWVRRVLTEKARKDMMVDGSYYRERAINHLLDTGQAETRAEAEEKLGRLLAYQKGGPRNGSLEHVRTADLPVDYYEKDFRKLLPIIMEGSAAYIARVEEFGQHAEKVMPALNRIGGRYGDIARKEVWENLQRAMGRGEEHWALRYPNKLVSISANIGLSAPSAPTRNVLFGIGSDITTFGVWATAQGIWKRLSHPVATYDRAVRMGAVESGARFYTQAGIKKWWTSRFMADTERYVIRPFSMMISEAAANDAVAVLQGKTGASLMYFLGGAMNPRAAAIHLFKDIYRFEAADVERIVKSGLSDADRKAIDYMGQRMAQGTASVAALPNWGPMSSSANFRTLALYKKMIHQSMRNFWNTVGGGIANKDFGPLIRWILTRTAIGFTMEEVFRRAVFGRRARQRNAPGLARLWDLFIKGEGLAWISNFVDKDRYGSAWDEFSGAVTTNVKRVLEELYDLGAGHQTKGQTIDDVLSIVAIKSFVENAMQRERADYLDVRGAYERKAKELGWKQDVDGEYALTDSSPYNRTIREALWSKPEDMNLAASSIEATVLYWMNARGKTRNEAEGIAKGTITRTRPITKKHGEEYLALVDDEERELTEKVLAQWKDQVRQVWTRYEERRDATLQEKASQETRHILKGRF